jgi:hypothetical protein
MKIMFTVYPNKLSDFLKGEEVSYSGIAGKAMIPEAFVLSAK